MLDTAANPSVAGDDALPLEVIGLTHQYPPPKAKRGAPVVAPAAALKTVNFSVKPGEIFGILGPNGSGKTTLFRILSTLLTPTGGVAKIFGDDVVRTPDRVRQNLGVVFQLPSLDGMLSAEENLTHQGHLYGLRGQVLKNRIAELLQQFGLDQRNTEWTGRFSGGMRRRVELAKALLHEPRLLLLDEPSTGLDPSARIELWRQLSDLRARRGVTIVLTTHLMEEADKCDRLAIMSQGQVVAIDTPENLKACIGGDVISIEPHSSDESEREKMLREITERWSPWAEGAAPKRVDSAIRFEHADGPGFVATVASAFAGRIRSISVGKPTLEDVFVHLTGQKLWLPGSDELPVKRKR